MSLQAVNRRDPGTEVLTERPVPLCVDLDGTLVRSDLLVESVLALLAKNIGFVFLLPLWLLRGKAYLKDQVAVRVTLDVDTLPYNHTVIETLRRARAGGRPTVLATASHRKFAQAIAEHLDLFDEVLATDAHENLSGPRKLTALRERFGEGGFDYMANGRVDLAIWPHAREAVLVNPGPGVEAAARRVATVTAVHTDASRGARAWVSALRPHQWVKNALIFVPLLAAHHATDAAALTQAAIAFIAFSLCASSVYLLNDLFDLAVDRAHPRKRHRPFAAGELPLVHGIAAVAILVAAAFGLAVWLPWEFVGVLGGYYLATLAYSLGLKRIVLVDVLLLAALYTVRIIAGGAAVSVPISFWLLAFSMFLFLSLALVKRYSELHMLNGQGQEKTRGRGYYTVDVDALTSMGTASGYLAVLVLALYINSDDVRHLYQRPEAIWLLCPLLLFWISRIWLHARRGWLHDDPVVFAIRDRVSRWIALFGALVVILAI